MTKRLLLAALALALLAPAAQAHVTVAVDPLGAPLVVGVPANVTVRFSEPCFEMPVEMASGNDALTAALAAGAPSFVKGTGETVPWTLDACEPSPDPTAFGGQVRQAAQLALVVDARAPAFTPLSIPVTYVDANGASTEGVPLNITVAYFASGTLTATPASGGHGAGHAGHAEHALALSLEYVTNADSILTFTATTPLGSVMLPAGQEVAPPAVTNQSTGTARAMLAFQPPVDWAQTTVTVQAFLAPKIGGAKVPVGNATVLLANDAPVDHDEHLHDQDAAKDAPAPAFVVLGLALLAVAARRR